MCLSTTLPPLHVSGLHPRADFPAGRQDGATRVFVEDEKKTALAPHGFRKEVVSTKTKTEAIYSGLHYQCG